MLLHEQQIVSLDEAGLLCALSPQDFCNAQQK